MEKSIIQYQCKSPVVLIVFNRPEETSILLKVLREVAPKKLYVISDGPRQGRQEDVRLVEKVRNLIDKEVDWDCDLNKIYANSNLSGPVRVPSGFDIVFSNEEQAIILEDDCIPSVDFFKFCDDLLEKYAKEERIGTICGFNLEFNFFGQIIENRHNTSYFFSRYPASWGWATWGRVWRNFDHDLKDYPLLLRRGFFNSISKDRYVRKFWINKFGKFYKKEKNNWDYKLTYSLLKNGQFSVIPNINLVQNIGTEGGTNYTKKDYVSKKKSNAISFPLKEPATIEPDDQYDNRVSEHFFNSSLFSKVMRLVRNKMI